jgi:hypothetical protein
MMQQQYDNSQAENLPKDRGTPVLDSDVASLESAGFYRSIENVVEDLPGLQIATYYQGWDVTVGYSDSFLSVRVARGDSCWIADLGHYDYLIDLPRLEELLRDDPKNLQARIEDVKRRKYERMMQAVAWVKCLLEGER